MGDPHAVAQSPYAVAKWGALAHGSHLHALHEQPVVYLRVFMDYNRVAPAWRGAKADRRGAERSTGSPPTSTSPPSALQPPMADPTLAAATRDQAKCADRDER
jgi:hypothetical protein